MEALYEDEFIIAVNKPAKQFVHPMPGEHESKNCLLFDVRNYIGSHVYAINRLDRPVSGVVLFAKKPEIVSAFQNIWHDSETKKKYLCLHRGKLEKSGEFNSALSKKGIYKTESSDKKQESLTLYKPLAYFHEQFCTYTEVEIKTGRYHQIRRHFRKAVMPIIGDRKHGKGAVNLQFAKDFGLNQIFLHCYSLSLCHPFTKGEITIESSLPDNLENVLQELQKRNL